MKDRNIMRAGFALGALAGLASASSSTVDPAGIIAQVICLLICEVIPIARAIAILIFVYGGAKYAYSGDDPGGRKQARSLAINAMIGFLIVQSARSLVLAIAPAGFTLCSC